VTLDDGSEVVFWNFAECDEPNILLLQ